MQHSEQSAQCPWAIASLVLGILVFCTMGLTGPFAVWTGVTSNRRRENSGMAIAGIVMGSVGSVIALVYLVSVSGSVFNRAAEKVQHSPSTPAPAQQAYNPYLTFSYVDSLLSSARGADSYTDVQRDQNWEWLRGRRVRWSGVVSEVYDRGGTCGVLLRCGSQTFSSDTSFDLPKQIAVKLVKDQRLTVDGTLASHGFTGYTLSNVTIVSW